MNVPAVALLRFALTKDLLRPPNSDGQQVCYAGGTVQARQRWIRRIGGRLDGDAGSVHVASRRLRDRCIDRADS